MNALGLNLLTSTALKAPAALPLPNSSSTPISTTISTPSSEGNEGHSDQVVMSATAKNNAKADPIATALANYAAAKEKTYFDGGKDAVQQATYYKDLCLDGTGTENFKALSKLVTQSHTNILPYEPSNYLYPWVDLRPNLQLESIYSSGNIDAVSSIKEDFAKAEYWNTMSQMAMTAAVAPTVAAAQMALTSNQYLNCEHVVCQSWFNHAQPMKGDLHHLFSCDPKGNSFRGNRPLASLDCQAVEMNESGGLSPGAKSFEPRQGKGAAARATLYFLLRYPKKIDEYQSQELQTLLRWHKEDPPGLYEKHRNQAISELQGNRNPFIDHPDWADKVDFTPGIRKRRSSAKEGSAKPSVCPIKVQNAPTIAVDSHGQLLAQDKAA